MDLSQNLIYLTLDVGYRVNIFHDQNLEGFLAAVNDDNKHKAII